MKLLTILIPTILAPVATTSLRLSPSPTAFLSTTSKSRSSSSLQMMASPTAAAAATAAVPKIAVIGGGAAGLVAARVLSRAGWNPVVLEQGDTIGGVWNYKPKDNSKGNQMDSQQQQKDSNSNVSPMYRGLRTNLPKEIMAFREFPWPDDLDLDLAVSPSNEVGEESASKAASTSSTPLTTTTTTDKSFVTHAQVQQYLQAYAERFDLKQYLRTGCQVEQLTVLPMVEDKNSTSTSSLLPQSRLSGATTATTTAKTITEKTEKWPRIQLDWRSHDDAAATTTTTSKQQLPLHSEIFDAVCVCNGHYSVPAVPDLPGLDQEYFQGLTMHSINYDDPKDFTGQTVLCIGGRASGADLAREIAPFAQHVYLSDTIPPSVDKNDDDGNNYSDGSVTKYNVTWVPKTIGVLKDGSIQLEANDVNGRNVQVPPISGVDVIIFCTGYDYSFPFCNDQSNLLFTAETGSRRVTPLYEQLWHAVNPNIVFVGLPHSVIPFPSFELQSEAVLATWRGDNIDDAAADNNSHAGDANSDTSRTLPDQKTRLQQAAIDARSGGEGKAPGTGRVPQDTHYLGSAQWDYCRRMAEYAGLYNDPVRDYLATNQVRAELCEYYAQHDVCLCVCSCTVYDRCCYWCCCYFVSL